MLGGEAPLLLPPACSLHRLAVAGKSRDTESNEHTHSLKYDNDPPLMYAVIINHAIFVCVYNRGQQKMADNQGNAAYPFGVSGVVLLMPTPSL